MPTLAQPASEHMERTCSVCKSTQAADQFYATSSECKSCGRKRAIARYHRDKERAANLSTQKCACGCGEFTEISIRTDRRRNYIAGQPNQFKNRHSRRLSPVEYLPEDRGYATPCWIWQRSKDREGYGFITSRRANGSRSARAHLVYYEAKHGPIPKGLVPDHLCRVPSCVNPDHIEPVTPAENTRRGASAKLTAKDVAEIRAALSAGALQDDLAATYGVTQTTISAIKRAITWNS